MFTIIEICMIKNNKKYRHGMSATELYEVTRGVWKLGIRHEYTMFAFAVFEGIVREVYVIDSWLPAGSTPYESQSISAVTLPGRWEFLCKIATDEIRSKYFGHSVASYLTQGAQNPIAYVNV
jgi:uncharacterized protein